MCCGNAIVWSFLSFVFSLLLQEFLKKEFSEENILFWQACEFFSQVPEHDKKQVCQQLRNDSSFQLAFSPH